MGQLVLANQMCFVSDGLSLNICALQTGEDTKTENEKVSENLEIMLLVLSLRQNVILYKIQNTGNNILNGKWD